MFGGFEDESRIDFWDRDLFRGRGNRPDRRFQPGFGWPWLLRLQWRL
jgi:hypothetical protein